MVFRAAVFDLDGTLIDSYQAIHESLSHVLATYGKPPVTAAETRRMVGHGLESLIAQAVDAALVQDGVRVFREHYRVVAPEKTWLLAGAAELIAALAERGVPMGIASNKPSYFSRQLLERLGLGERFVDIVGPDRGFPPKPAPDMVLALLASMGAAPAETLFIGDMPVDVQTARAVGMPIAVLPTGSSDREELQACAPDCLLGGLMDVLDLF